MTSSPDIQSIFYNNPDQHPPIINSTRLLVRAGYKVDILCREVGEHWNVYYPAGAQIGRIDGRGRSSWQEYIRFVAQVFLRAAKYSSIFIGHDMHGFLPARMLATCYRRPLVYHCHDFADRTRVLPVGSRIVQAFEQRFAQTADLVIVPDKERAEIISQELRLRRPPLVVANSPLSTFDGNGSALASALASRGKRFSRILFRQGRIGEGHAIEATLHSMPYWRDSGWGFVLMGLGDSSYVKRLSRLAQSLNVEERLVMLPSVAYDEVPCYTLGAHVGHALYEPIHFNHLYSTTASNKLIEYMAAGLPLLLSDRPALTTFLAKYKCGLTADESSPDSIARAVNALLGDRERAHSMGKAGRQAFQQELCYERQFAPVQEAFRSLLRAESQTSEHGMNPGKAGKTKIL